MPPAPRRPDRADPAWTDALLVEMGWVRALARRLVNGRDGDAEDLAQSVLAMAIEQRPPVGKGLRGWLALAARRLAIRRRQREGRAPLPLEDAPPAPAADPAQTVERLELHRWLVDQVLALPEPYRSTLVAHYVEGHSTTAVAAARSTSPATVRKQLSRGTALLRERLRTDGDGRDWRAGIVALAGFSPLPVAQCAPTATIAATPSLLFAITGVTLVKATLLTAAASLVALALFFSWDRSDTRPAFESSNSDSASPHTDAPTGHASADPSHTTDTGAEVARRAEPAASATADGSIALRIVGGAGLPLANMTAIVFPDVDRPPAHAIRSGHSDDQGHVDLPPVAGGPPPRSWKLCVAGPGRPGKSYELTTQVAGKRQEIVCGDAGTIEGSVELHPSWRTPASTPVLPQKLLCAQPRLDVPDEVRRLLRAESMDFFGRAIAPVEAGHFSFKSLLGDRGTLALPYESPFLICPPPLGETEVEIGRHDVRVVVIPSPAVRGRIVYDDGRPVANAQLFVLATFVDSQAPGISAQANAEGEFCVRLAHSNTPIHKWADPEAAPRLARISVSVDDASARSLGRQFTDLGGQLIVDVGDLVLTRLPIVHVRALSPGGEPVAGAVFANGSRPSEPTGLDGRTRLALGEADAPIEAGAPGWCVDAYEPRAGDGSEENPLEFVLQPGNRLAFQLGASEFAPGDLSLVLLGPRELYTRDRAEDGVGTLGPHIHRAIGVSPFQSGGLDLASGQVERKAHWPEEGEFALESLLPGRAVKLMVSDAAGTLVGEVSTTTPSAGERRTVEVPIRTGVCTIKGQIVGPRGLDLSRTRADTFYGVRVSDSGTFELRLGATGEDVELRLVHPECLPCSLTIPLQAGTTSPTFTLSPGLDVVACAVYPDGRIADAEIRAVDHGKGERLVDGRTRIAKLPPGPVELVAQHAGQTFRTTVDPAEAPEIVEIPVPIPLSIPLRVDEAVDRGRTLSVSVVEAEGDGRTRLQLTFVDGGWQPETIDLHPGTYRVRWSQDGSSSESTWIVEPGTREARVIGG